MPVHPAAVHFPIAFLSLHYILDILYGLATTPSTAKLTSSLFSTLTNQSLALTLPSLTTASYYMNVLGFLTAIPAVLSGGQQLLQMMAKQDLANKMAKSGDKVATARKMHPKMKVGFAHAALSDALVAAAGYGWYVRRNAVGFAPSGMEVLGSAGLMGLLFFTAHLGGELTYEHGVAVKIAKRD